MKVERNILNKKNLAELENLVNRLDVAVTEALEIIPTEDLEEILEKLTKEVDELDAELKRRDEEKRREALRNELLAAYDK